MQVPYFANLKAFTNPTFSIFKALGGVHAIIDSPFQIINEIEISIEIFVYIAKHYDNI